ncbi:hypothetical protein Hokovirus_2_70 [Hokovirus HKV1]|uniref:Uncharacterized protein n=1 Tax=Hokovirus HKV1 TaxID=1977638 RepID=A0A1V0SFQ7_9VIRU|nr:hypothetical protein Hokovirus_2_70 [Hokovirus HKV1]
MDNKILNNSYVDYSLYFIIPILYNVFVHVIASVVNQNLPYKDKHSNSLLIMYIFGILGIIVYKMKYGKMDELMNICLYGIGIGGLLLIITAILIDWHNLNDITQVILISVIFIAIFYYYYDYNNYND